MLTTLTENHARKGWESVKRHLCRNCGQHSLELESSKRHRNARQFFAHRYYVCLTCRSRFVTVEGVYRVRPTYYVKKDSTDPEEPRLPLKKPNR